MIKLTDIKIETDVTKFPYLKQFVEKFNPPLDITIFVHGTTLYIKNPRHAIYSIKVHELTHMNQQVEVGIDVWFDKYLNDDKQRLEWEIEAYQNERDCMRRNDWVKRLHQILPYLCGEMYGNIISREQAYVLLR